MTGAPGTFCRATPGAEPPDPSVLDGDMLPIDIDVVRVTLHVLAATIWVGGQIVLVALMPTLRRTVPEAIAPVARAFAWVSWPAFAVLILTGLWSLGVVGAAMSDEAYRTTMMLKLTLVALSGLGAALHTFAKRPVLKGIWGAVGLLGALGAVLLGVSL
jgi:putative copper export protein